MWAKRLPAMAARTSAAWRALSNRWAQTSVPTLVTTGAAETQLADAADVWRGWARDVRATTAPCGHFIPEEAPDFTTAELIRFLGGR